MANSLNNVQQVQVNKSPHSLHADKKLPDSKQFEAAIYKALIESDKFGSCELVRILLNSMDWSSVAERTRWISTGYRSPDFRFSVKPISNRFTGGYKEANAAAWTMECK